VRLPADPIGIAIAIAIGFASVRKTTAMPIAAAIPIPIPDDQVHVPLPINWLVFGLWIGGRHRSAAPRREVSLQLAAGRKNMIPGSRN